MREPESDTGDAGDAAGGGSKVLFVVARGQADLRAAIEWALRGLPGLEIIEDRRQDGSLLSRPEHESRGPSPPPSGDPDPDQPTGRDGPSAIARVPWTAWPGSLTWCG